MYCDFAIMHLLSPSLTHSHSHRLPSSLVVARHLFGTSLVCADIHTCCVFVMAKAMPYIETSFYGILSYAPALVIFSTLLQ